jgi:hypothetical protein
MLDADRFVALASSFPGLERVELCGAGLQLKLKQPPPQEQLALDVELIGRHNPA